MLNFLTIWLILTKFKLSKKKVMQPSLRLFCYRMISFGIKEQNRK